AIAEALKHDDVALFHEVVHGAIDNDRRVLGRLMGCIRAKGGKSRQERRLELLAFVRDKVRAPSRYPGIKVHYVVYHFQKLMWPRDNDDLTRSIKNILNVLTQICQAASLERSVREYKINQIAGIIKRGISERAYTVRELEKRFAALGADNPEYAVICRRIAEKLSGEITIKLILNVPHVFKNAARAFWFAAGMGVLCALPVAAVVLLTGSMEIEWAWITCGVAAFLSLYSFIVLEKIEMIKKINEDSLQEQKALRLQQAATVVRADTGLSSELFTLNKEIATSPDIFGGSPGELLARKLEEQRRRIRAHMTNIDAIEFAGAPSVRVRLTDLLLRRREVTAVIVAGLSGAFFAGLSFLAGKRLLYNKVTVGGQEVTIPSRVVDRAHFHVVVKVPEKGKYVIFTVTKTAGEVAALKRALGSVHDTIRAKIGRHEEGMLDRDADAREKKIMKLWADEVNLIDPRSIDLYEAMPIEGAAGMESFSAGEAIHVPLAVLSDERILAHTVARESLRRIIGDWETLKATQAEQEKIITIIMDRVFGPDNPGVGVLNAGILPHRQKGNVNDAIVQVVGKHLAEIEENAKEGYGLTPEEEAQFRKFEAWFKNKKNRGKDVPPENWLPVEKIAADHIRVDAGPGSHRLWIVELPVDNFGPVAGETFTAHLGLTARNENEGIIWVAAGTAQKARNNEDIELDILHEKEECRIALEWLDEKNEEAKKQKKSITLRDMITWRDSGSAACAQFFSGAHIKACEAVEGACELECDDEEARDIEARLRMFEKAKKRLREAQEKTNPVIPAGAGVGVIAGGRTPKTKKILSTKQVYGDPRYFVKATQRKMLAKMRKAQKEKRIDEESTHVYFEMKRESRYLAPDKGPLKGYVRILSDKDIQDALRPLPEFLLKGITYRRIRDFGYGLYMFRTEQKIPGGIMHRGEICVPDFTVGALDKEVDAMEDTGAAWGKPLDTQEQKIAFIREVYKIAIAHEVAELLRMAMDRSLYRYADLWCSHGEWPVRRSSRVPIAADAEHTFCDAFAKYFWPTNPVMRRYRQPKAERRAIAEIVELARKKPEGAYFESGDYDAILDRLGKNPVVEYAGSVKNIDLKKMRIPEDMLYAAADHAGLTLRKLTKKGKCYERTIHDGKTRIGDICRINDESGKAPFYRIELNEDVDTASLRKIEGFIKYIDKHLTDREEMKDEPSLTPPKAPAGLAWSWGESFRALADALWREDEGALFLPAFIGGEVDEGTGDRMIRDFNNRRAIDGTEIANTQEILRAIIPVLEKKDELKYYTIRYDKTKIPQGSPAEALLKSYCEHVLPMYIRGEDRVRLKASAAPNKGVIWVERYSDRQRNESAKIGEGHVDVAFDITGRVINIIGMMNIAFIAAHIPADLTPDKIGAYDPLIIFIKKQYKELTGKDLQKEFWQELSRGVWITLERLEPVNPDEFEYYQTATRQLEEAV
ncbi:MAG: hypothetical protein PHS37_04245, partial [Candidatus Omnitrophica bacterium]|nr:hypothetical protein [Candidatus Omnitrophota bacterium]